MEDTAGAFVSVFTIDGAADGPLSDLSFAAKDLYDVAGHVTGCGNPDWARTHGPAARHAPAVSALLDGGARLVGKTHTDELAYSLMGVNAHYGTPLNTAAPDRVPGGSSSGSVAAVAAGLANIGLGSDTGGSVRMPASFCGVWGLRTTFGRFALDDAMALAPSFDTVGWFTRDLDTLACVVSACGGGKALTPARLILPVDAWARADAATIDALSPLVARLQASLCPSEPVLLADDGVEGLVQWREAFRLHQGREVWQVHGAWVTEMRPAFGPGIADRFAMAAAITDAEFDWSEKMRRAILDRVLPMLGDDTVMVLPSSPGPAPLLTTPQADLDGFRARALEILCIAGHAGLPQLSVPGASVNGAPVGLSLVGPRGSEEMLLGAAQAFT